MKMTDQIVGAIIKALFWGQVVLNIVFFLMALPIAFLIFAGFKIQDAFTFEDHPSCML